jgi:hypothetical protein
MGEKYGTNNPLKTDPTRVIEVKILNALNGGAGGGSGGTATNGVFSGNYGGGQPNFTPTATQAIAIDTSNGRVWNYWSGAWY